MNLAILLLSAATVVGHPEWMKSSAWSASEPSLVKVDACEGRLAWEISATASNGVQRVLLKKPVAVPPQTELFVDALRSSNGSMTFEALVADAKGREFLVSLVGRTFLAKSNFFGGGFRPEWFSCGEWRIRTAGLSQLQPGKWRSADGRGGSPVLPFSFLGFQFSVQGKLEPGHTLWMRRFQFADASYRNSSFYYTLWGQEMYGETDGEAKICPLDVNGRLWGPKHVFEWEMRDRFDGPPIWQGCVTNDTPWGKGAVNRPYRFHFPRVEVPIRDVGSYWIRMRVQSRYKPNGAPGEEFTYEYRYDVFTGEKSRPHEAVPERNWLPVTRQRLAKQAKIRAEAVCRRNDYVKPPLPTSEDVRTGGHSLVELCTGRDASASLKLLDEMAKHDFRREIEIQTSWADMEPLEGVYDFRAVDTVLEAAAQKGVACLVTFATLMPPEWMRSSFTENEEGYRMGHNIYLFNGGRINVFNDPFVRGKAMAFCESLIRHVRNHPALLGYFYIVEHGGDMPSSRWYEGYDGFTRANFRDWLLTRYGTIGALNAAWGATFGAFAEVEPPHQLHPRTEDTPLRIREWMDFKLERIESLQFDVCRLARELDPTRVIMIYGSPTFGQGVFDYTKIGVLTANGGCHGLNNGYYYTAIGEAGLYQRMEEHSCTSWTRYWPTQLDTSLFAMLHGGGLMTHMKMFWPAGAKMDDPKMRDLNGFGRFAKFVPIMAELRGARRVWDSAAGWSSSRGCSYGEWNWAMVENAQLQARTSITPKWRDAKIVFVSPHERQLWQREVEELKGYVANGGTLFMTCRTGESVLEDSCSSNALLRAFGLSDPMPMPGKNRAWATARQGSPWWGRGGEDESAYRTMLSEPVRSPADAGETLLAFMDGSPALTRRRYGKGAVCVLWAGNYVPYSCIENLDWRKPCLRSRHFMKELAADAGMRPLVNCDRRDVYALLLEKQAAFYLLTMSKDDMPEAAEITIDCPGVSSSAVDLITGEKRTFPLKEKLSGKEVRIWKIVKRPEEAGSVK